MWPCTTTVVGVWSPETEPNEHRARRSTPWTLSRQPGWSCRPTNFLLASLKSRQNIADGRPTISGSFINKNACPAPLPLPKQSKRNTTWTQRANTKMCGRDGGDGSKLLQNLIQRDATFTLFSVEQNCFYHRRQETCTTSFSQHGNPGHRTHGATQTQNAKWSTKKKTQQEGMGENSGKKGMLRAGCTTIGCHASTAL